MKDPRHFRTWVEEAMLCGVNIFLLDCYTPARLRLFREVFGGSHNLFFDDAFVPYRYRGPRTRIICIKDATFTKEHVKENRLLQYHNQGGNSWLKPNEPNPWNIEVLQEPVQRMCTRPFREFVMWYDGAVSVCCDDWNAEAVLARFPEQSLEECWDALDSYRRDLVEKKRVKTPCNRCSERAGSSWGLELDWFRRER
jgi:hypothetical protein